MQNFSLRINEVYPGTSQDWVEIFLLSDSTCSADLSSFLIRDSTETNKLSLSGSLNPGEYVSFPFSNKLNNAGDSVRLFSAISGSEELIDSVTYGGEACAPVEGQSIGRKPDGTGGFVLLSQATKDVSNTSGEYICTTPAPSPSPTKKPSPTPKPETSRPSPTATIALLVDNEQTAGEEQEAEEEGMVLGESASESQELEFYPLGEQATTAEASVAGTQSTSRLSWVFGIAGVGVTVISLVLLAWGVYRRYNGRPSTE